GASYLWSTGATSPSINVTTTGNYTVTVTNANGCSAMSAPKSVTVNTVPATPVINASGPTTFCAGGSVTLTAPAGFTYLWSTGATTQSIVASTTNNYTVTVTNAGGCSAVSAPKSVTVNAATSITQQPQSATIPRNSTTQLSVTATGTGTLTYQWYRGTSPSTATPISGATSSTYTTPRLNKGTYTYWVKVTGSCGVANSTTATISVP
ncbi:MAG TPA: xylanase, partial [Thermoanaerobaculia bacterium]